MALKFTERHLQRECLMGVRLSVTTIIVRQAYPLLPLIVSESSLYVRETMLLRPREAGTWFALCAFPADAVKKALVRPALSAAGTSQSMSILW